METTTVSFLDRLERLRTSATSLDRMVTVTCDRYGPYLQIDASRVGFHTQERLADQICRTVHSASTAYRREVDMITNAGMGGPAPAPSETAQGKRWRQYGTDLNRIVVMVKSPREWATVRVVGRKTAEVKLRPGLFDDEHYRLSVLEREINTALSQATVEYERRRAAAYRRVFAATTSPLLRPASAR